MATGNLAKEVFLTPPLSIAGCQLWLDGTDTSSMVFSSGSNVSQWNDKSGLANHATAGGTGSPVLTQNSINGNQALYMSLNPYFTGPISNTGSTLSCFAVVLQTALPTDSRIISLATADTYDYNSPNAIPLFTRQSTGNLETYRSGIIATITATQNVGYLAECIYDGTSGYLYRNGILAGSSGSTGTFSASKYGLGTRANVSSTEYWQGYFGEFHIFINALTTLQRQQVEGYLSWKWGLQRSLPASHAYASSSPYQTLSLPISRGIALKATSSSYFLPTAISGCQLWMDATDSTTITRSGANVTQWNDKANLYTGTATNNPQYNSNPINGLPTIHFDGASSRYVLLTANNFNYSFMTYFMVIRWVSGSGGFMGTDTPSNYGRALQVTSPYVYMLLYSQFYTTTVQLTANQPCILSAYFNSTTDFTVIVNGVKTLFSVAQGAGNTNTNGFNIGVSNPSNTGSHSFDMGEGIVYNSILSDAQRQQVEGYLAWKWGLTSSLQQPHPNSTTAYVPFPFPTVIPQASTRVWSPTRISGTQLWFDGADVGSMTLSGINVTQWNDKSGNGRNVTTNGTSPTYNASLINSLGGIDCTNSGSLISSGFQNSANLSFAMVAVVKSGIGAWGSFFTHGGRDLDFSVERNSVSSGTTIHFQSADDNSTCDITFTVDAPVIYYGTMTAGTNRFFESFSGGTNVTTTGTNTYRMTLASVVARIGKSDNNEVCNSYIGEIIYYTNVLPLSQQQQIEGYLAWKWGLQTSLPGGHPYINFPPSP